MRQVPTGNPASTLGIRYGAILGIILVVVAAIGLASYNLSRVFSLPSDVIGLGMFLAVGIHTARKTGTASSGAIAGLLAGAISAVINAVVVIVLTLAFVNRYRANEQRSLQQSAALFGLKNTQLNVTNAEVLTGAIASVVIGLVVATVVGAGIGALGGLIGRGGYRPQQPYQETMYQGLGTPPPAPGFPPATGTPPPAPGGWPEPTPPASPPEP